MIEAPLPLSEAERLAALHNYGILDTLPENEFDDIVKLASHICGTEIALISFVANDHLWFKTRVGVDVTHTPRSVSFCGHAILQDDLMVVENCTLDERFADNPLVTAPPFLRFYAGQPLVTPDGQHIGTICVASDKPAQLDAVQRQTMKVLSRHVIALLEERLKTRKLEETIEQCRDIQRISTAGGWELDLVTQTTHWTNVVYDIHGLDHRLPVPKGEALDFFPEPARSQLVAALDACVQHQEPYDLVLPFVDANGNAKVVRTVGKAIADETGQTRLVRGSIQDITALASKEAEAQEYNRYLELALEGAGLGIWDWYLEDNRVRFDRRWAEMLGLDINSIDMSLATWEQRVHPDDLAGCYRDIQAYLRGETPHYENIHRVRHAKGHWVYILDKGKISQWNEAGHPVRFTGTHLDITDNEHYRAKLKLLFDNTNVGFAFCDMDGRLIEVNRKYCEITGYSEQELLQMDVWQLLPEAQASKSRMDLRTLTPGDICGPTRGLCVRKDGSEVPIETKGCLVEDYDSMHGIWTMVEDITEKLLMEDKLVHQSKLATIGEMSAGIGHEINNPLAIINGYIDEMRNYLCRAHDIPMQHSVLLGKHMEKLETACDRIQHIVGGLRSFARSDVRETARLELGDLLDSTIDMVNLIFDKQDVQFRIGKLQAAPLWIMGNKGKLQQVLLNLFSNARDALAANAAGERWISVSLSATGDTACLLVSDNGPGIPAEHHHRIFTPFFTSKTHNEGTGLGLAIARNLLMEHGGDIALDDTGGPGATFRVTLPLLREKPEARRSAAPAAVAPVIPAPSAGARVLVVDDEPDLLKLLSLYLQRLQCQVQVANCGEDAIGIISKGAEHYDLVITDIKMKGISGIELASQIRGSDLPRQPRILLSTGGVDLDLDEFRQPDKLGIDGYLYKPYSFSTIREKLGELLQVQ